MKLLQGILTVFGFGQEQKRIKTEWENAVKNMQTSTREVHNQRNTINKLHTAKQKIIDSREKIVRMSNDGLR